MAVFFRNLDKISWPSTTLRPLQSGAPTAGAAAVASIPSSSSRAPSLESGSLRLPHFGDCTHEGQPPVQGHSAISLRASPQSFSKRANAAHASEAEAVKGKLGREGRPA